MDPVADRQFDLKDFFMVRTVLTDDGVCRNTAEFLLSVFLKFALIVPITLVQDSIQILLKTLQDHLRCISQRAIKINGRQHRFKGISQKRGLGTAAGEFLSASNEEVVA